MRRGDPGGTRHLLMTLEPAFYDILASKRDIHAIGMPIEAADSLPLVLRVRARSASERQWLAEARVPSGGRFLLSLDERSGSGQFWRLGGKDDNRVFVAIVGLFVRR